MKNMTFEENLRENQKFSHLMEMSLFRKFETGLSVNIWVDPKETFNNEKKIYFQLDNGDNPNSNHMIPMTISDYPEIKIDNLSKIKLSKDEINQIKQFIILNLDILKQLGDGIGIAEFAKQMKKVN